MNLTTNQFPSLHRQMKRALWHNAHFLVGTLGFYLGILISEATHPQITVLTNKLCVIEPHTVLGRNDLRFSVSPII